MMRHRSVARALLLYCVAACVASGCLSGINAQTSPELRQVSAIRLDKVRGRIDHLAFDPARQRLFIAALGNDTVEVVDTAKGTLLRSITGFHEPQGLAVVTDANGVAVANGGTGTLQLLDAETFSVRWTTPIGGDADNVRYDSTARRIYVAAEGGLYAVDPGTGKRTGLVAIDGHPESFQLEARGPRVFANLPGLITASIVMGDRQKAVVRARWPTQNCGSNYPMALDEGAGRLFIGCRRPARLAIVDTASGRFVTGIDIVGDSDDLFYDADRRRVYVIGGDGFVDIVTRNADSIVRAGRVSTRPGARTGLWVPSQSRLYVAVPARGGDPAEVRVFEAQKN
jgi:DNA-binding beta-propeller fold protein YncE